MGDPSGSPKNNNPVDDVREELNEAMPPVARSAIIRETLRAASRDGELTITDVTVTSVDAAGLGVPEYPRSPPEGSPARAGQVHVMNTHPLVSSHSDVSPGLEVIQRSRSVRVYNDAGEATPFGDLLDQVRTPATNKLMTIFLRHFFCGSCQEYVRALSKAFPNPDQDLPDGCKIVLIGCGAHTLISQYRASTGCPFEIYSDPTAQLFSIFAMRRTLDMGKHSPAFTKRSMMSMTMSGIKQGLKRIFKGDAFKSGRPNQNGGEILFEFEREQAGRAIGMLAIRATWCHIMKTTLDHAPIEVLRRVLGMPLSEEEAANAPRAIAAAPLGSLL
ncbi:hypothetical protein MGYG_04407 [Nannizzia gypsea CBS 118893]|uniref:Uncharacterized protein n=1 Tax=Arthroderma gypseum (strain ATCC MYA-4604 / CBS 118893) TaxID=535722 RepID=E4USV1_ARTGP|nr:hypothetical protein MGYG_04407 [Nannizzia gypsea CBS 118893]EFR01400.1 hypothetical protein MGYG_04407 [Nannizzia gypsea CBS 118893]